MREREHAASTLAASVAPLETRAVVPSVLPAASAERPAPVRVPVRGVVRSPVPAVLMARSAMAPAEAVSVVRAAVSGARRPRNASERRPDCGKGRR